MVLMEDWVLSGSPFSVSIGHRWVLWENSCQVPPKQVWVVHQSSGMELVVVHDEWSLVSQTSSETLAYEEYEPEVREPASDVEVLDWEFSNNGKSKKASELGTSSIISPVPV